MAQTKINKVKAGMGVPLFCGKAFPKYLNIVLTEAQLHRSSVTQLAKLLVKAADRIAGRITKLATNCVAQTEFDMLLFDLAGADERLRWSPFCWRVKLALKHKKLPYDTVPWHYFQKELITRSGQGAVPVLVVGDRYLADSWQIAEHLESAYPDRRTLFREPTPHALTRFIQHWVEAEVHTHLRHLTMLDMLTQLDPRDQVYFRTSREKTFGQRLEDFCADRAGHQQRLQRSLEPARRLLLSQPYLCGDEPAFADHLLLSALLWGRVACAQELLESSDPVAHWRDGLIQSYQISLP